MNEIEKYYNKFNEDKRLLSRHGIVEFRIALKYIEEVIGGRTNLNIIDIGAGTGRYSKALVDLGHNVTAVELVQKNLSQIRLKSEKINAVKGNALKLKFKEETFDIALLFGPLYHLFSFEDKLKAINEAKRVVKKGGTILIMYLTCDYAFITYAIKEGNLKKCIAENKITNDFKLNTTEKDLYSYLSLDDINKLALASEMERYKIVGVDGATDYIRPFINKLDDEDFETYIKYQISRAEKPELIGASSHILDILKK